MASHHEEPDEESTSLHITPCYTDRVARARRAFVVGWILLGIAGALDQTVAPAVAGRRFDLFLPHLKYGHVMFNHNPRQVPVLSYAGSDGARHDLVDLEATPALGYSRARLSIVFAIKPDYLAELCLRAERAGRGELTFIVDQYDLDVDRDRPSATQRLHCDAHGLAQR